MIWQCVGERLTEVTVGCARFATTTEHCGSVVVTHGARLAETLNQASRQVAVVTETAHLALVEDRILSASEPWVHPSAVAGIDPAR